MRIIGIIVALIVAAYLGYQLAFPTYTYRYRMTVEVTVDGQTKSGSSILEVRMRKQTQFIVQVPPYEPGVTGEAVFVDLGEGRNVIALLASGPDATNVNYPAYLVPRHFKLSNSDGDVRRYPTLQGRWDLPADGLPTLVRFSNLDDPTTARVVHPAEFEQVFGKGVRFERAIVEMVPAGWWPFSALGWPPSLAGVPVTKGIEKKLPWWNLEGRPAEQAYRAWLAGQTTGPSIGPETLFKRN